MRDQRRHASADEDDRYDLGNAPDPEKHGYNTRHSSLEYDDDSPSSQSGFSRETSGSHQPMLHKTASRRTKSYYFYRLPNRTVRYLCLALMSTIIIFILSLVRMSWASSKALEMGLVRGKTPQPAQWESFEFLKRYYGGIRTLVSRDINIPEYPSENEPSDVTAEHVSVATRTLQPSTPFNPYPDYKSTAYIKENGPVHECFLHSGDGIKVPKVHSYHGVPQGLPDAIIGSNDVLNLRNDICFERYGRLGPYGFGYSLRKGGIGAGLDGDREGAEDVWKEVDEVDYTNVRWDKAQQDCLIKNGHRFKPELLSSKGKTFQSMRVRQADDPARREEPPAEFARMNTSHAGIIHGDTANETKASINLLPRTAVIIRTWWDFVYASEDILYLRSLISELSLLSGGEYTIHFLIHVKDDNSPIWADDKVYNKVLQDALPEEFHGMGTLWSERQMGLIYGGLAESFFRDLPVHGVYRSSFMPLQYFAHQHPEYDYFWNWEMDIRYTGHWYHLFDNIRRFAKEQPRKGLWERNGRFYIPFIHGSWEDFKQMVRVQTEMGTESPNNIWSGPKAGQPKQGSAPQRKIDKPIWGPHATGQNLETQEDPVPPTSYEKDKYTWGVGEEADLITLNPMFDPEGTTWLLSDDVTGYNTTEGLPPRRAAIITASRLSRRLLDVMHREVALARHSMFSEMWPPSCALHHGLKAVYAPHPLYIDRNWPMQYLANVMNGGKNGAAGGARTSVFGDREHNFRGTTWYYNAGFSPNLWRRWLGYRVDNGGGEEEEMAGEGRMCLPGMLLHPVKGVDLVVEGWKDGEYVPDNAEGGDSI
ncbi:hypothetical protein MMC24_002124 [Lignoscripta atroalba]|nr:hypothetical protein [Lignoscripta atroalba]